METKEFIKSLKDDARNIECVSYRQALCWYLYKEGVPCSVISKALHCKRRQVYRRMYVCRDLLEANDALMKEAVSEIKSHSISVKSVDVEVNICTFHNGYALIIDNEIY